MKRKCFYFNSTSKELYEDRLQRLLDEGYEVTHTVSLYCSGSAMKGDALIFLEKRVAPYPKPLDTSPV